MRHTSMKSLAVVGAMAAMTLLHSGSASAQLVQAGDPFTFPVAATVENTLTITVNAALDFGQIGAIRDPVDIATLSVSAAGVVTDSPGDGMGGAFPAAIVSDPANLPTLGNVTVAGFELTDIYVTYDNCADLTDGVFTFTLTGVVDSLPTPGSTDCTTPVIGQGTTDAGGLLTYNIGASIATTTGAYGPYADGAYVGSFDATWSY